MPLPALTVALPILKKVVPLLGPEAVKQAKKLIGDKKLRATAHRMASERNGRVGEVTFNDGARRWLVADAEGKAIKAFPDYGDGSREQLLEGTQGIDFDKCLGRPDPDVKEEERQRKEQEKANKRAAGEQKKAEKVLPENS